MPPKKKEEPEPEPEVSFDEPEEPELQLWQSSDYDGQWKSPELTEERTPHTGAFNVDYIVACKELGVVPHPHLKQSLISSHADEKSRRERAHESACEAARGEEPPMAEPDLPPADGEGAVQWITEGEAIRTELSVSGWLLDNGTMTVLEDTLPKCKKVHSLKLKHSGMSAAQVVRLVKLLPETGVRTVRLEFEGGLMQPDEPAAAPADDASQTGAASGAEDGEGEGTDEPEPEVEPVAAGEDEEEPEEEIPTTLPAAYVSLMSPKRNSLLFCLSLRGNCLSDVEAGTIAEYLRTNTTLRVLNLGQNKITDAGAGAIASAMQGNRCCQSLSLAYNRLTDACAGDLCHALGRFEMTEEARAEHTVAYDAFSELHKKWDTDLQGLIAKKKPTDQHEKEEPIWDGVVVDDEGFQAGNRTLRSLNLMGNHLSKVSTAKFLPVLSFNAALTSLCIDQNDVNWSELGMKLSDLEGNQSALSVTGKQAALDMKARIEEEEAVARAKVEEAEAAKRAAEEEAAMLAAAEGEGEGAEEAE